MCLFFYKTAKSAGMQRDYKRNRHTMGHLENWQERDDEEERQERTHAISLIIMEHEFFFSA